MIQIRLVFGTSNPGKIKEVAEVIKGGIEIVGLNEIGCYEDIPETNPTLEENALQKARYVKDNYGYDCFSEDTGLEIFGLNGEPGVYSARYAGEDKNSSNNIDLVLQKMEGMTNREAQFRTVVALILDGKEYTFEGAVKGHITTERHGDGGFGYDPIFIPEGKQLSFAEMSSADKNEISHRGRAIKKFLSFFKELVETK